MRALVIFILAIFSLTLAPERSDALTLVNNGRWQQDATGWTIVRVCYVAGSNAGKGSMRVAKYHMRGALAQWEKGSSVRFVDWRWCDVIPQSRRAEFVGLYLDGDPDMATDAFDGERANKGKTGPYTDTDSNVRQYAVRLNAWGRSMAPCDDFEGKCIREYAAHEFGHVLGYVHEGLRPDRFANCDGKIEEPETTEIPYQYMHIIRNADEVRSVGNWPYNGANGRNFRKYVGLGRYDKKSIMTYDTDCPNDDYDTVRFGSTGLSATDKKFHRLVYPEPDTGRYDVGVLSGDHRCDSEWITVFMDAEDAGKSYMSGWQGRSWSDRKGNVALEFCRTNGLNFQRTDGAYSVLKLGRDCPPGSKGQKIYLDNEDTNNANFVSGNISPGSVNKDGTLLHLCYFKSRSTSPNNFSFPNLNYSYGVFSKEVKGANVVGTKGFFFIDDENSENNNKYRKKFRATGSDHPIEQNHNTKFHVKRVR